MGNEWGFASAWHPQEHGVVGKGGVTVIVPQIPFGKCRCWMIRVRDTDEGDRLRLSS
jgi:hypothetical protein